MTGSVLALIGLGFTLVYKCSKILNLAQGAFVLVGSYVCWAFVVQAGLPFWLSLVIAMVILFVLGWLLERFPLRPIIGQSEEALFMVSLGLYVAFMGIVNLIWTGEIRVFPKVFPLTALMVGSISITYQYLYSFLICIMLFIAFYLFFRFTKTGLRMRSVAESHKISQSIGVSVTRAMALAWAIAAMVATAAGVMIGTTTVVHTGLAELGLSGLAVALFGGLDSIGGVIIAGLIMGILQSLVGGYVSFELSTIVPYVIVVLVLLFRPYGLFGLERIERV
jgi:branched-chain amino acid transport system permease protein